MLNRIVWVQRLAAAFVLSAALINTAFAQLTPEVSKGLIWLQAQVQPDGHLASETTAIATLLQSRAESLRTLRQLATGPTALNTSITADTENNTEYLARHLLSADAAADNSALLISLIAQQNADGGFAALAGYQSNALDTAWALLAFKAVPSSASANAVANGLAYLVKSINAEGSYSPSPEYPGDVETTAYSLLALQNYSQVMPLATQINLAKQWLVSQRNVNGTYGSIYCNALCALALLNTGDVGTYAGAVTSLKAAQLADGSWAADPYLTALALRVLTAAAQGPAVPTVGQIQGVVIDATTSAAIAGAQIQVVELPTKSTVSAADGNFILVDLPAGTYTLRISQAGYNVVTTSATVNAGSFTNVGGIKLATATNTATLRGQIRDGATGAPMAGVSIALTSGTTTPATQTVLTDTQGSYQFAGVPAGSATAQLSKSGYTNISTMTQLVAGSIVIYSPALYITGTTPAVASLKGQVLDSVSANPLAAATIKVGAATAITDSSGNFTLTSVAVGAYTADVSATGYYPATLNGLTSLGSNSVGTIKLQKIPTTTRISGVVAETGSNAPLAGATVSIPGTKLITQSAADGSYQLTGVVTPQFSVVFSLNGYISQTVYTQTNAAGLVPINANLNQSGNSGISVTSAQPSFGPYVNAEFTVTITNSFPRGDIQAIVNAVVVDAQQNVLAEIAARPLSLSQPLSDAVIYISPGYPDVEKLKWNTGPNLPGDYRFVARVSNAKGVVQTEISLPFTILPVQQIGGSLTLNPPISQLDNPNPVQMTAKISNRGNLPISPGQVQLAITLKNPDTLPKTVHPLLLQTLAELDPALKLQSGVFDQAGNYYAINTRDSIVLKITPTGQVSDFIKPSVVYGLQDLTVDKDGNLYVLFPYGQSNYGDGGYLKLTPAGVETRVATKLGVQNAIDLDQAGNIYITGLLATNQYANSLLKIDPAGVQTVLMSNGINNPIGIVFDKSGNLFVANYGDGMIVKILPGAKITSFASGLVRPQGITIDAQGNLFVANSGENNVVKITPDGTKSVYASNLPNLYDLKFDSSGKLYVSLPTNNSIEVVSSTGGVSTFATGAANDPLGMKYDSAGNLYIVNYGDATLTKLDTANNVSVLATGLSNPYGMTINANGEVFIANSGNNSITKTSAGVTSTYSTSVVNPISVTVDSADTLYVAEANPRRISTISPTGQSQVFAETLVNDPREIQINTNGEQFVLNKNSIAKLGGANNSAGNVIVRNLDTSQSFALSSSGGFVVLDYYGTILKTFDSNGNLLTSTNLGYGASGVAVDLAGAIYLADAANSRINKFDNTGTSTPFAQLPSTPKAMTYGNGLLHALLDSGQVVSIDTSGTVTVRASGVQGYKLATDASGKIYVSIYNGLSVIDANGSITQPITGLGYSTGVAINSAGQVLLAEPNFIRVATYDVQNGLVGTTVGFGNPFDLIWANNNLIFSDRFRIYSMIPGQNPKVMGDVPSDYLAWNNGTLYFTQGGRVAKLNANGAAQFFPPVANYDSARGLAVRADGTISFGNRIDSSVVALSSVGQLLSANASIIYPHAVAIDATDNVYVGSSNNIVKIDKTSKHADVFIKSAGAYAMQFDANGIFYYTDGNGDLSKQDANGVNTTLQAQRGTSGIAVLNGDIYLSNSNSYKIAVNKNNVVSTYAAGMSDSRGIKVGKDGSLYIAGAGTGTVQRFNQGVLETFASGLLYPRSLAFGPSGNLYVAGGYGNLAQISPAGQVTDLKSELLIDSFEGISVDARETLYLTAKNLGRIYKAGLPSIPGTATPTATGAVVYNTIATLSGSLPVGGDGLLTDFGNWKPIEGGDYDIAITSSNGVPGSVSNSIHIGPNVAGSIGTSKTKLTPVLANIGVQVNVKGADFSDVTKADPSKVSTINPTQIFNGENFGVTTDNLGNIYVAKGNANSNGVIVRYDSTGQETVLVSSKRIMPGIGIDSKQNLYYTTYPDNSLIRRAIDGTEQVIATIPTTLNANGYQVAGLAVNSRDFVLVLTLKGIIKVAPNGSQSLFNDTGVNTNGYGVYPGLTIDGNDNLYLQNAGLRNYSSDVLTKISADGLTASVMSSSLLFESEGFVLAGDCSNNLLASIYHNYNDYGTSEAHSLKRIDGKTLQVTTVLAYPSLPNGGDMDNIFYDKYSGNAMFYDDQSQRIYKFPLTCGGLGADLHMVFPAGQAVSGFNLAPPASIVKPDGSTEYVWNLKDVKTAGQDVKFDTTFIGQNLGDKRKLASEAYLSFKNTFVAGDIRVPLTIPELTVDNAVSLAVNTDKPGYPTRSPVMINIGIGNPNTQTIAGTLKLDLVDAAGLLVAPVGNQTASIAGNGQQLISLPFNTADIIAGGYRIRATLTDAQGAVQAQSFTALKILSGDGSNGQLTTAVTSDKSVYGPSDPVRFTARLTNAGTNTLLNNVRAVATIVGPAGVTLFTGEQTIPQLGGGALRDLNFTYPLVNAVPGVYTITIKVYDELGALQGTKTLTFSVSSTAVNGTGLVGNVAVLPKQVSIGDSIVLAAGITNNGNTDLTGLNLKLSVVDPVNQQMLAQWPYSVNLVRGQHTTFATDWRSVGAAGSTLVALISASVAGQDKVLAQDTFTLIQTPVKLNVTQQLTQTSRVLVLVTCKKGENDDINTVDLDDVACTPIRAAFVDSYLTGLAITHKVVTTEVDFRKEFRRGVYDVYWISGGAVKLKDTLAEELREAVYRGDSLIIDGIHDERNKALDAVIGVRYTGKLGSLTPNLTVLPSAAGITEGLLPAGSYVGVGRGLKLTLAGAAEYAKFDGVQCKPDEDKTKPLGDCPAIVGQTYGAGQALEFAFNLVDSLRKAPTDARWQALFNAAIGKMQPKVTTTPPLPGGYVSFNTLVKNLGQPVDTQVSITLPTGSVQMGGVPQAQIDAAGHNVWRFNLPLNASQSLGLNFLAPQLAGRHRIETDVASVRNGQLVPYDHYGFDLEVTSAQANVISLVNDLTLLVFSAKADRDLRDKAVKAIQTAMTNVAQNKLENAVKSLLEASEGLAQIKVDMQIQRQRVDRLLQEIEQKWFKTLTP